ncbi:MAG: hypothetical protein IIA87_04795 [Nanoarchaeota archaeon]|nr:hypothetical protein [Nanoarchaeota archaeon]
MEPQDNKEIDEVEDEIEGALKDPRGLVVHQKRLAFCLSSGIVNILEDYLKNKGVLKQGVKLNHQWFKKKKENVKSIITEKITTSLDSLVKLDRILDVAYNIESKRNELVYGKKVSEKVLRDLISQYLDLKKEVEENGS